MPTPKFDPTINFGHLVTAITLFLTIGVGWALIDARTQHNLDAILTIQGSIAHYESRLRNVELQQTRTDERFTYLQNTMNEIRAGVNELRNGRKQP